MTRILVVDDDPDTRQLLCQYLGQKGWDTEGQGDAYQALIELRDAHYDVLVADYMMPGANGLVLVERLASSDIDIPVVLVTALVPGPVTDAAAEAGVVAVVSKERADVDLVPAVERALASRAPVSPGDV